MSEQDLVEAIRRAYAALPAKERIKKIKELSACGKRTKAFIKKLFPEFHKEAFSKKKKKSKHTKTPAGTRIPAKVKV